jgi:uncharacterized protein GlcG (DUF336 family)
MTSLTLHFADTLIDAALKKGRELKLAPLTVAVLDAGGHLVALKREDHSGIFRVEIARDRQRQGLWRARHGLRLP